MAFHRKLRLEHAKILIKSGNDYFSAGYNIGYESSSGFRKAFKKEFGMSPGSLIDGK
ncbi:MAG: helix-turn-helix transcriptional regulator [Candidatus Marinimicrobia bacterium]|nr:helix-turn-helix transcriptional regulator [Candidatus Neomarinimicrobiota bacterium]